MESLQTRYHVTKASAEMYNACQLFYLSSLEDIFFIAFRERTMEREKHRCEKYPSVASHGRWTQMEQAPSGDGTPGTRPDRESTRNLPVTRRRSSQLSYTSQACRLLFLDNEERW